MFSSRLLPLSKPLKRTEDASQTSGGQAAKPTRTSLEGACRTQPLPAPERATAPPPVPGAYTSAGGSEGRLSFRSSRSCRMVPVQPVSPDSDGAAMSTSPRRAWPPLGCVGSSLEARLRITQAFKLTPYVPYFPIYFVTTEKSDSPLLQNRKRHVTLKSLGFATPSRRGKHSSGLHPKPSVLPGSWRTGAALRLFTPPSHVQVPLPSPPAPAAPQVGKAAAPLSPQAGELPAQVLLLQSRGTKAPEKGCCYPEEAKENETGGQRLTEQAGLGRQPAPGEHSVPSVQLQCFAQRPEKGPPPKALVSTVLVRATNSYKNQENIRETSVSP
nr:PREDICTED: verprolin-like [Apteryx mantelli mantelli]